MGLGLGLVLIMEACLDRGLGIEAWLGLVWILILAQTLGTIIIRTPCVCIRRETWACIWWVPSIRARGIPSMWLRVVTLSLLWVLSASIKGYAHSK